jgi:ABC-type lipoprotein export system ATPase subunit
VTGDGSLIRLADVVKTFETPAGSFVALNGVTLTVGSGEYVAVIGKSGSGKTTLLNLITGIDRPTRGEIWIAGTPVHALSESRTAQWRGRTVGVVFQFFQLLPTISLLDNVVLPMEFCGLYSREERRRRARALLERVELGDHTGKLPAELSGGQQQRAAIARALATDPPLVVADEPTGNLDSKSAANTFALFEELVAAGKTVLIVTHDNDLAARARRTVVLADGETINEYVRQALAPLDLDELALASSRLRRETYPPGALIVRQGDEPEDFYIVTSGEVEVVLEHPGGQEILVNRLGRGQYFGEIALLRGGRRVATVRACPSGEVEVMALDRETFSRAIGESEIARRDFDRVIAERLRSLA